MRFILASASPRRRELLMSINLDFEVVPSHIPEVRGEGESPEEYVARLSREKAAAIAEKFPTDWVIAADTTVLLGDQLLEKPLDAEDAARMLAKIAGKTHNVLPRVTPPNPEEEWPQTRGGESGSAKAAARGPEVRLDRATRRPLHKAGAYAVQGTGAMFIDSIHGSYTNVVG